MQRQIFNLNQLYHEAKALIEKYDFVNPKHQLDVSFGIREEKGSPTTTVYISYGEYNQKDRVFAHGSNPINALSDLEKGLQEQTNKTLSVNKLEMVFEIPEV